MKKKRVIFQIVASMKKVPIIVAVFVIGTTLISCASVSWVEYKSYQRASCITEFTLIDMDYGITIGVEYRIGTQGFRSGLINLQCPTVECVDEQEQFSNNGEFSCFANRSQYVVLERDILRPVALATVGGIFVVGLLVYGLTTNKHQPLKDIILGK